MTPPKPLSREGKVPFWRYLKLFRQDILSAQPDRLYRAKMATFRTPFFRSYMINEPELIATVLKDRPMAFPKSSRVAEGLRPLLGQSVFLTNGDVWRAQRRIINPAFEGGRIHDNLPAMQAAADDMIARLRERKGETEFEAVMSFATADVIFRALFSISISDEIAAEVFREFRRFQRAQPLLNLGAFLPVPRWMPRFFRRDAIQSASRIRTLIHELCNDRLQAIEQGIAPDDLATKIMTQKDPETGRCFTLAEMVDQVAIFFLAGHETSASALSWTAYLLATHPDAQDRIAAEVANLPAQAKMSDIMALRFTRNVFREALRLYPPVPMMVRENTEQEEIRNADVPRGSQIVISPWHLHRNDRYWDDPDVFDPDRFDRKETQQSQRDAFIPFSAGPRVCPGTGFAMTEGVLLTALLVKAFKLTASPDKIPVPVAHLTVRAADGIYLSVEPRK